MDEHEETVALVCAPSDGADEFADTRSDNEDVLAVIEEDRRSADAPSPSYMHCSPASRPTSMMLALVLAAVVAGAGYVFRTGGEMHSTAHAGASEHTGGSSSSSLTMHSAAGPSEHTGGGSSSSSSSPTQCPELAALAGETSRCATSRSSRAADILRAQELLLRGANGSILPSAHHAGQSSMTPAWVMRRDPSFGLWLWPRLKLVLFACPKCGNSQVRVLLNAASEEVQKNEEEDIMAVKPPGGWAKESDHSWQARSPRVEGFHNGMKETHTNLLAFERNDAAYQYIDEMLVDPEWSSLGVIRHPYGRLMSGFSELELRWQKFAGDPQQYRGQQFSLGALDDRSSYWREEKETPERALAFWADYVGGNFYLPDPASHCLFPIAEAYHLSPVGSFFLKDSSVCEASSLYNVNHTIDIDELSRDWPEFIRHWANYWDAEVAEELANMARKHGNSHAGSTNTLLMKELLKDNDALRESVDAFYSHDFSHFGFVKDPAIIDRLR